MVIVIVVDVLVLDWFVVVDTVQFGFMSFCFDSKDVLLRIVKCLFLVLVLA